MFLVFILLRFLKNFNQFENYVQIFLVIFIVFFTNSPKIKVK
jgi:hypothetical protein